MPSSQGDVVTPTKKGGTFRGLGPAEQGSRLRSRAKDAKIKTLRAQIDLALDWKPEHVEDVVDTLKSLGHVFDENEKPAAVRRRKSAAKLEPDDTAADGLATTKVEDPGAPQGKQAVAETSKHKGRNPKHRSI